MIKYVPVYHYNKIHSDDEGYACDIKTSTKNDTYDSDESTK